MADLIRAALAMFSLGFLVTRFAWLFEAIRMGIATLYQGHASRTVVRIRNE